jgi:hypothetical protein
MGMRAHSISLTVMSASTMWVTRFRMRREDRCSMPCFFPLADLGGKTSATDHVRLFSVQLLSSVTVAVPSFSNRSARRKHNLSSSPISLVRPCRRLSLAPTAGCPGRRAQDVSRLAALQRPPSGSAFTRPSTTADSRVRGECLHRFGLCRQGSRIATGITVLFAVEPCSPHHGPSKASVPLCPERSHERAPEGIARSPRPVPAGTLVRLGGE